MDRSLSGTRRSNSINAMDYATETFSASPNPQSDEHNMSAMKRALQVLSGKRRSASPSPTRSLNTPSRTAIFTPIRAQTDPDDYGTYRFRERQQNQRANTSGHCRPARDSTSSNRSPPQSRAMLCPTRPRRSSVRLIHLLEAEDFTSAELERPLELSRKICQLPFGCVSRPHPEHCWRVATKRLSPEMCFTTSLPIYSARHHSPLVTSHSKTIYFEYDVGTVTSDDPVYFAVGFVAGRDRAFKMPGLERGSVGVQSKDGALYLNNKRLGNISRGAFKPGQKLGIGMTFSVSEGGSDSDSSVRTTPSDIQVEVFMTRGGRRIATWDISDQAPESLDLYREGFEGSHDIYAAIGTRGEVNVDMFFERVDWENHLEAK